MKKNNLNGKKISLSIVLTLFLILFSLSSLSAYSGLGDGSSENPYQITNCNQLQEMNSGLTSNYVLMNNVDCSDTVNWNSGAGFLPIGDYFNQFIGNLNGQGYKITNLYSRAGGYYVALI